MVPMIDPVAMEHEALVGAQDCEAAVASVAGERHQHGGQGNGEGEAAGDLDVDGELRYTLKVAAPRTLPPSPIARGSRRLEGGRDDATVGSD